jgi:hypothetical protein
MRKRPLLRTTCPDRRRFFFSGSDSFLFFCSFRVFLCDVVMLQRLDSGSGCVAAPSEVVLVLFGSMCRVVLFFTRVACSVSRLFCL